MWSRNMGKNGKEGFKDSSSPKESVAMVSAPDVTTDPTTLDTFLKDNFYTTNKKNPLGNVLLTEIMDSPDRKSAPPALYHTSVDCKPHIHNSLLVLSIFCKISTKNSMNQGFLRLLSPLISMEKLKL